VRNYGASLGLAVLGTILLTVQRSKLTTSLRAQHVPHAPQVAATFSQSKGGHALSSIPLYFSRDFAYATQAVLYVMCGIIGVAGLVALRFLRRGLQEATPDDLAHGEAAGLRTE
jgi:hypothetical protein